MCACEGVCLCSCQLAKKELAIREAHCNFQMDSQTCIRFSGKVVHEQKDS